MERGSVFRRIDDGLGVGLSAKHGNGDRNRNGAI